MVFINEYVSSEDIKKYRLDQSFLKRNPAYEEIPSGYKHKWTIDKERNFYLQCTGMANQAREDEVWIEFTLVMSGLIFIFRLELGAGSINFNESPYIIVWDSLKIFYPHDFHGLPQEDVISVLKEALLVYGYDGARKQIENTIVKFNF